MTHKLKSKFFLQAQKITIKVSIQLRYVLWIFWVTTE